MDSIDHLLDVFGELFVPQLLVIPHEWYHRKVGRQHFEGQWVVNRIWLYFFDTCVDPALIDCLRSIGIASSQKCNILGKWCALKSAINHNFFYVAELICCIELVKKDPYFLHVISIFLRSFGKLVHPLWYLHFCDSSVNVVNEQLFHVNNIN